jgi:hypothetical protein
MPQPALPAITPHIKELDDLAPKHRHHDGAFSPAWHHDCAAEWEDTPESAECLVTAIEPAFSNPAWRL